MTAAALAHELIEARDEKRLLRLQRQYAAYKLLIVDELGYVPLSQTGADSQRYERGATLVTSNLPFDEWTSIFGSERLTGALLDRLTHHVHILEMQVVAGGPGRKIAEIIGRDPDELLALAGRLLRRSAQKHRSVQRPGIASTWGISR